MVHKAYRFRIYPTKEQEILIAKTLGCCRYVYNRYLHQRNEHYRLTGKGLSNGACSADLTRHKQGVPWLKEPDSTALQSSLKNLDTAFKNFFSGTAQYPRFKSKRHLVQSYTAKNNNHSIRVAENRVLVNKLGWIRFAKSREVTGRILSATLRRNASGTYHISILVETAVSPMPKTGKTCGVDMGLKTLAVTSSGLTYLNPRHFKTLEDKLAREQRKLSRRYQQAKKDKKPLSEAKNYQKQKVQVARLHEKIANRRNDYLHQVSSHLVKNHDLIGMEDLQVANMVKNPTLSKTISDASWGTLQKMVAYKAAWYGKELILVGKTFPSSQLCSACGIKNPVVKDLSLRTWVCEACGAHHDRDENASHNIEAEAIRLRTAGTAGIA